MNKLVNKSVTVITIDGRHYTGVLRGYDQVHNIVLAETIEHVWKSDAPKETLEQGLMMIRGDCVCMVGRTTAELPETAEPIPPIMLN